MITKQILRWIAVLPGALLAVIFVAFPVHWVVMYIQLTDDPEDSSLLAIIPPIILEYLGMALFGPFTFVAVGARIAPHYKFRTAVVLAVILMAFLQFSHTYFAAQGYEVMANYGTFRRVLTHVLQIAGLSWGLFYAFKADKAPNTEL